MESDQVRDGFDFHIGVPKEMFRNLDAHAGHELSWRHAEIGPTEISKMATRHPDRRSDSRKRGGSGKMIAEIVYGATDDGIETGSGMVLAIHGERGREMVHKIVQVVRLWHDRADRQRCELGGCPSLGTSS